jgi:hypothetical protein
MPESPGAQQRSGLAFRQHRRQHPLSGQEFLFAAGDNNKDIYTFSIASDGAIKQVGEINPLKYSDGCGTIGPLQIDNTGSSLYLQVNDSCQDNDFIQLFPPIRFIGDDKIGWEPGLVPMTAW